MPRLRPAIEAHEGVRAELAREEIDDGSLTAVAKGEIDNHDSASLIVKHFREMRLRDAAGAWNEPSLWRRHRLAAGESDGCCLAGANL